jgi:hypothetical protein
VSRHDVSAGCGDCRLCCRVLEVKEIEKPFLEWCRHPKRGVGCAIYETRPESCRAFVCTWLASQRAGPPDGAPWDRMPPELRPDRCGVIFAPVDQIDRLSPARPCRPAPANGVDPQGRQRLDRAHRARGITVVLSVGDKHTVLRNDLPNMRGNRKGWDHET